MGWIARLFGGLWSFAKSATRFDFPNRGVSTLGCFLFMVFAFIAAVAMLFGIELDALDRWFDGQSGWMESLGSMLFRLVCALILLFCSLAVALGLWQRIQSVRIAESEPDEDKLGWGAMIAAAIFGYFAWFGMVG